MRQVTARQTKGITAAEAATAGAAAIQESRFSSSVPNRFPSAEQVLHELHCRAGHLVRLQRLLQATQLFR